jgi:hypothetical protein
MFVSFVERVVDGGTICCLGSWWEPISMLYMQLLPLLKGGGGKKSFKQDLVGCGANVKYYGSFTPAF